MVEEAPERLVGFEQLRPAGWRGWRHISVTDVSRCFGPVRDSRFSTANDSSTKIHSRHIRGSRHREIRSFLVFLAQSKGAAVQPFDEAYVTLLCAEYNPRQRPSLYTNTSIERMMPCSSGLSDSNCNNAVSPSISTCSTTGCCAR